MTFVLNRDLQTACNKSANDLALVASHVGRAAALFRPDRAVRPQQPAPYQQRLFLLATSMLPG